MRQASDILDTTAALTGVGGDREFLWELLGIFRAAWPTLLRDIREALVKGDLRPVKNAARLVKVAAQNVAARRVSAAALLLEETATYGELQGARQACSRLEEAIDQLESTLVVLGNSVVCSRC